MSLSLSVCLSVGSLFNLEHSKHMNLAFTRMSPGCFNGVLRVSQVYFKVVLRVFKVYSKGVLKMFLGYFKVVSRVNQGYYDQLRLAK